MVFFVCTYMFLLWKTLEVIGDDFKAEICRFFVNLIVVLSKRMLSILYKHIGTHIYKLMVMDYKIGN